MGIDFNSTVFNSSNQIELSRNGQFIAVKGQLTGSSFSVTQKKQTTPPVDLLVDYDLTIDQSNQTALVQSFTLDGKQQQQPLLRGALSKPMKLDWGKASNAVDESAFDLTLTDLNLADWRAFVGEFVSAGRVNAKVNLLSQQAGKKLKLEVSSQIGALTATFGSNKIEQADVTLAVRGEVDYFSKVQLAEYSLQLAHEKRLEREADERREAENKQRAIWVYAIFSSLSIFYFLPSVIGRKKRNFVALFVLNLLGFLAWAGWVIECLNHDLSD